MQTNNNNNKEPAAPPLVIMAAGFGTQKDFGLDRYAEKFVQAGIAVFLFDYRNFGLCLDCMESLLCRAQEWLAYQQREQQQQQQPLHRADTPHVEGQDLNLFFANFLVAQGHEQRSAPAA